MSHKQLTREQRYLIYGLYCAGYTQTDIAKEVGVHKSTIGREIRRNSRWSGYYPEQAHCVTEDRRRLAKKCKKVTPVVEAFLREKLLLDWSPDQISGYAKRHSLFSLSHERIYQFVLADKEKGGTLYLHLRHQHKRYRTRYGSPARNEPIKNRIFIDARPKVVDEKSRIGDWEIDTIIGGNRQQAIVTIVERFSKKMVCKKLANRQAVTIQAATINVLKPFADRVLSVTADNGSEFASHESISRALNTTFYFAHPYSSWERGLNENTNGLIRQYLPKGCDFTGIQEEELETIMDKLNNRPRKTLSYATPNEVFNSS